MNIFDFDKDLYDQTITTIFRYRLRDEKKFENTEQLADQMKLDKETGTEVAWSEQSH